VDPVFVQHPRDLARVLPDLLRDGDLVLLQGAGDIGAVAQELANGFAGRGTPPEQRS
jgi:UDP-N-acetylmuramate--alanine ligase